MFNCNREINDLIDLLETVDREVELFAHLVNARDWKVTAKDGFWTLTIYYNSSESADKLFFCQDYETVEDLRNAVTMYRIGAKMACGKEI